MDRPTMFYRLGGRVVFSPGMPAPWPLVRSRDERVLAFGHAGQNVAMPPAIPARAALVAIGGAA
ncbi:MAG: hypothetical protein JWN27_2948 [Candidatus Eremiobacteraeota bacterium]|nr:hypothetical protein [Candidatus Eremiobacteraeota bacterium]